MFVYLLLLAAPAASLKVLDVGAPRTGTQTLQAAFQILGMKTLHTGENVSYRIPWCQYMEGGKVGQPPVGMLDHVDAAMDEPMQLIFPEVMAAYPEVKFIYTLRDPEDWFSSYESIMKDLRAYGELRRQQTSSRLRKNSHSNLVPVMEAVDQVVKNVTRDCEACSYWGCKFGLPDSLEAKPRCIKSFQDHFNEVKSTIPPDRLLLYNLTDGWGPLCEFLNLPIPNEDFPHEDWVRTGTEDYLRKYGAAPQPESDGTVAFVQRQAVARRAAEL